jgi:hypothetical protein
LFNFIFFPAIPEPSANGKWTEVGESHAHPVILVRLPDGRKNQRVTIAFENRRLESTIIPKGFFLTSAVARPESGHSPPLSSLFMAAEFGSLYEACFALPQKEAESLQIVFSEAAKSFIGFTFPSAGRSRISNHP